MRRDGLGYQQLTRTARGFAWMLVAVVLGMPSLVVGQEAEWIWWADHPKAEVPETVCHFRKSFTAEQPESCRIEMVADDEFELFVNGRRIGRGNSSKRLASFDVSAHIKPGRNTVAVWVSNRTGSTAALAARVMVKERESGWVSHSTNDSWLSSLNALPLWNTSVYTDRRWKASQSFGKLGDTAPWDIQEGVATEERDRAERFRVSEDFEVRRLIDDDLTGSLIAMTFNEFGHAILSQENGPLLLAYDSNGDFQLDKVRTYCEKVTSCQGILALNGEVFVTGTGPDGYALYRLSDEDNDGVLERARTLVKFQEQTGEHGAHGIALGPDGMLYVVLGNHIQPKREYETSSPYQNPYEGDLVQPRYEDPGGHAVGIKAPGGVVLRVTIEGKQLQQVCGGLRNAYDLAFTEQGDLFVHDSDMESDRGSLWYRPTQLYHVTEGAEFGWRSGWSKWPEYFVDNMPALLDTGRGSPTGAVTYNHVAFPARYRGAMFLADWSEGRILAVKTKQSGSSYIANSEVFLEGSPLNVTDLAVAPDGDLYFITGGRKTSGGLYRVHWKGDVNKSAMDLGQGISAAIRQPQLHSAWGRQSIAQIQTQLGDRWAPLLVSVARSPANPANYRTRALDFMQWFGPLPTQELLVELAATKNEQVRAKAAYLMGLYPTPETQAALVRLMEDKDGYVRRRACEALLRGGQTTSFDKLAPLLASQDRAEAWAARRLLERMPPHEWKEQMLASQDHSVLVRGALALMIADPNRQNAAAVLDQFSKVMAGFVSDRDFIEMLRVMQVAMIRGAIQPEEMIPLRNQLVEEFPASDPVMNRELIRLLTHLQASSIMDRYFAYLDSDVPNADRLHLALHMRFLESGWTGDRRMALLQFLEKSQRNSKGNAVPLYVMHATRDFCRSMTAEESRLVLSKASDWPNAALGALFQVPKELDAELLGYIKDIDQAIADRSGDTITRLKVGIIAVLSRSGDQESMKYLHEIWKREPELRQPIALGLSQQPGGSNWSYLLHSLAVVEGQVAQEVLSQLKTVDQRPVQSQYYRQVILNGLKLDAKNAAVAVELLEHWTAQQTPEEHSAEVSDQLAYWQGWFQDRFPGKPAAKLPVAPEGSKWTFSNLADYLTTGEGAHGNAQRGALVFEKSQCVKCHRFGDSGEVMGPDLSNIRKRFTKKEILESIVFPSHVISDQYRSRQIVTTDGRIYGGLVVPGPGEQWIVLQANGKKITVPKGQVETVENSKQSAMPAQLLDKLTLEEITDLFAYLGVLPKTAVARRPE